MLGPFAIPIRNDEVGGGDKDLRWPVAVDDFALWEVCLNPSQRRFQNRFDADEKPVLRLDLVHPLAGGNKWYKLRYNLQGLQPGERILSFGGAWSNHLHAESSDIMLQLESRARQADPPTERLEADWRQRMEDVLWALTNNVELVFVP